MFRRDKVSELLNIEAKDLRVITTDVGGGFGMKLFNYPEYICSLFATSKNNFLWFWRS